MFSLCFPTENAAGREHRNPDSQISNSKSEHKIPKPRISSLIFQSDSHKKTKMGYLQVAPCMGALGDADGSAGPEPAKT